MSSQELGKSGDASWKHVGQAIDEASPMIVPRSIAQETLSTIDDPGSAKRSARNSRVHQMAVVQESAELSPPMPSPKRSQWRQPSASSTVIVHNVPSSEGNGPSSLKSPTTTVEPLSREGSEELDDVDVKDDNDRWQALFEGSTQKKAGLSDLYAPYVPQVVLKHTIKHFDQEDMRSFKGVVVFADISGYSSLAHLLQQKGGVDDPLGGVLQNSEVMASKGAEAVRDILNEYFGGVMNLFLLHGGDIVKIAGDALMVSWTVPEVQLPVAVYQISRACMSILEVFGEKEVHGHTLSLHMGIGCGSIVPLIVGGTVDSGKKFLIIRGPAVDQATEAVSKAKRGQCALSKTAFEAMNSVLLQSTHSDGVDIITNPGADPELLSATVWNSDLEKQFDSQGKSSTSILQILTSAKNNEEFLWTPDLDRTVSGFCNSAVVLHARAFRNHDLAELRNATILFIMMHPNPEDYSVTLDAISERDSGLMLKAACHVIQQACYTFGGNMREFGLDDKGIVGLAGFGVPPKSHGDDPIRACLAAMTIQAELRAMGLGCSIGIATGPIWCGSIGCSWRREFVMVGSIVNLAARLMGAQKGVLTDQQTRNIASSRLTFVPSGAINCKGFSDPISVFVPTADSGIVSDSLPQIDTVGRDKEISTLNLKIGRYIDEISHLQSIEDAIMQGIDNEKSSAFGLRCPIFIEGEPGMGKTKLLSDVITIAESKDCYVVKSKSSKLASESSSTSTFLARLFASLLSIRVKTGRQDETYRSPGGFSEADIGGGTLTLSMAASKEEAMLGHPNSHATMSFSTPRVPWDASFSARSAGASEKSGSSGLVMSSPGITSMKEGDFAKNVELASEIRKQLAEAQKQMQGTMFTFSAEEHDAILPINTHELFDPSLSEDGNVQQEISSLPGQADESDKHPNSVKSDFAGMLMTSADMKSRMKWSSLTSERAVVVIMHCFGANMKEAIKESRLATNSSGTIKFDSANRVSGIPDLDVLSPAWHLLSDSDLDHPVSDAEVAYWIYRLCLHRSFLFYKAISEEENNSSLAGDSDMLAASVNGGTLRGLDSLAKSGSSARVFIPKLTCALVIDNFHHTSASSMKVIQKLAQFPMIVAVACTPHFESTSARCAYLKLRASILDQAIAEPDTETEVSQQSALDLTRNMSVGTTHSIDSPSRGGMISTVKSVEEPFGPRSHSVESVQKSNSAGPVYFRLGPIDRFGCEQLVALLTGADCGCHPHVTSFLHERTHGNPKFMRDWVRALLDAGQLLVAKLQKLDVKILEKVASSGSILSKSSLDTPGRKKFAQFAPDVNYGAYPLPPFSLRAHISNLIDRLSPLEQSVLRVCAVCGHGCTAGMVYLVMRRRLSAQKTGRRERHNSIASDLSDSNEEFLLEGDSARRSLRHSSSRKLAKKLSILDQAQMNSLDGVEDRGFCLNDVVKAMDRLLNRGILTGESDSDVCISQGFKSDDSECNITSEIELWKSFMDILRKNDRDSSVASIGNAEYTRSMNVAFKFSWLLLQDSVYSRIPFGERKTLHHVILEISMIGIQHKICLGSGKNAIDPLSLSKAIDTIDTDFYSHVSTGQASSIGSKPPVPKLNLGGSSTEPLKFIQSNQLPTERAHGPLSKSYSVLAFEGSQNGVLTAQTQLLTNFGILILPIRLFAFLINHASLADKRSLAAEWAELLPQGLLESFMAGEAVYQFGVKNATTQSLQNMASIDGPEEDSNGNLVDKGRFIRGEQADKTEKPYKKIGGFDTHYVLVHIPLVPWLRGLHQVAMIRAWRKIGNATGAVRAAAKFKAKLRPKPNATPRDDTTVEQRAAESNQHKETASPISSAQKKTKGKSCTIL